MTFTAAVKGITRENGIMPDYSVKPKIEDIIKQKDTVKEFAYGLIGNSN